MFYNHLTTGHIPDKYAEQIFSKCQYQKCFSFYRRILYKYNLPDEPRLLFSHFTWVGPKSI